MLRTFLSLLLLVLLGSSTASAQWITGTDTAYTDKIISFSINDTAFMKGAPDNRYATFEERDEAYVFFRPGPETEKTFPIKPGAKLIIYGRQQPGSNPDSSGVFVFFEGAANGLPSQLFIARDSVTTITVPDTLYQSVTITNIFHPLVGDIITLDTFYVDAIKLVQKFDPLWVRRSDDARITSAFPNPFSVGIGTKLSFSTDRFGMLSLLIMDIAGREINTIDIGARPMGSHQIEINVPNEGFFMAQLLIDGVPAGKMLRLSAQY